MMTPTSVGVAVSEGTSSEADARAFASPKSSTLTLSVGRHLDVGRLEIPVNHPFLVRGFEGVGDLEGQLQRLLDRNRAAPETIRQRAAFDELEDEKARAVIGLESVNRRDVGMVQRRQQRRLTFESGDAIGVLRERVRQHLDGDFTAECGVARLPHLAHATLADGGKNLVVTQSRAPLQPVLGPGPVSKRDRGGRRQRLDRRPLRKAPRGHVCHEQRFHLALQFAIVTAGSADEHPALVRTPFQGVLKHLLDAIPPPDVVVHRLLIGPPRRVRQPHKQAGQSWEPTQIVEKTCRLGAPSGGRMDRTRKGVADCLIARDREARNGSTRSPI